MMNRRYALARRPQGEPRPDDFRLEEGPLTPLPDGAFRVRNHYASLDPAMRGWMDDRPSYMPPIPLGEAVRASTVGVVHESRHPGFVPGDWVLGLNALEDYSTVLPGGFTQRIDVSAVPSPTNYLSVLGAVGLTAYFGMRDLGRPQPGQTVLVSGAAGAVGSLVGQIAKIHGARAVGIAGGLAKCARLTDRYGYDAAIDHRGKNTAQLAGDIRAACPDGVDVVFENIGGACLDAALLNLADRARVILCGLISEYNAPEPAGARNLWQLIVKAASIHGLLVRDYAPHFPEGAAEMAKWLTAGQLRFDEHIDEGLENAYPAFMRLFSGGNDGKMILKIA